MPYLIGMDEAGYGPNLGPLVISASVWRVPKGTDLARRDLYELLREAVCAKRDSAASGSHRIAIADSKLLFKPRQSIAPLEAGLFGCLAQFSELPDRWRNGWSRLAGEAGAHRVDAPWYTEYDRALPLAGDLVTIDRSRQLLNMTLQRAGVSLVAIRSTAIFPREFNEQCARFGSKGAVLTDRTIRLLAELIEPLEESCHVVCDKHGGRNRYAAVLQNYFPGQPLAILAEARAESSYRLSGPRPLSVRFRAGGEQFLPAALASMASKYLRELAMLAFNDYWLAAMPGLRPTAGYPLDAKRFRAEIVTEQQARRIADECLWREK